MALNMYRMYFISGPGQVDYTQVKDMDAVVKWIVYKNPKDGDAWGIEAFDTTQNTWIDDFCSDDMVKLYKAIRISNMADFLGIRLKEES